MTTVSLPDGRLEARRARAVDATSLRAWLADRWAILFSHPEDFAQEELEADRWISIVSRSFSARGVAPLALARAGYESRGGWLGCLAALSRESAAVLTLDPPLPGAPADFSAAALRAHIARNGARFAMIIDASLRCRRALSYRSGAELPSPLDLIGWAVALRKRDSLAQGSGETPEPSLRPAWAGSGRCVVAQAGRR